MISIGWAHEDTTFILFFGLKVFSRVIKYCIRNTSMFFFFLQIAATDLAFTHQLLNFAQVQFEVW